MLLCGRQRVGGTSVGATSAARGPGARTLAGTVASGRERGTGGGVLLPDTATAIAAPLLPLPPRRLPHACAPWLPLPSLLSLPPLPSRLRHRSLARACRRWATGGPGGTIGLPIRTAVGERASRQTGVCLAL